MADTRNVLLRLDGDLADSVTAIAEVEGRSVSDVMREALAEHVERRRRDRSFQRKVSEARQRHARLLDLLSEDDRG